MGCFKLLFQIIFLPITILLKIPKKVYITLAKSLLFLIFLPFIIIYWLFKKYQETSSKIYLYLMLGFIIFCVFTLIFNNISSGMKAQQASETQAAQVAIQSTNSAAQMATRNQLSTEDAFATQTATLWTLTPSFTPSETLTPSLTPIASHTPTITDTPLLTNTNRPTDTPQAQTDNSNSDIGNQPTATLELFQSDNNMLFAAHSMKIYTKVKDRTPDEGKVYLLLAGILANRSDRRECLTASDIRLILDGKEYRPDGGLMADMQDNLNPRIDYIGVWSGHCVPKGEQETTFVAFEVPITATEVYLRVSDDERPLAVEWSSFIEFSLNTQDLIKISELAVTVTQSAIELATENANATATATLWTDTPTPSITPSPEPTNTPKSTNTRSPSRTPQPTNTRPPLRTPRPSTTTYYINSSANLRAEPNTNGSPVGSLSWGSEIQVIDNNVRGESVSGSTRWYQISYRGGIAYVHSTLVSDTKPVQQPVQVQSSGSSNTSSSGGSSTGSSGNSSGFTCPKNCDAARAMGLTAEQAATCPGLDRDHDGLACYGT